jgi:beta-galactosidase
LAESNFKVIIWKRNGGASMIFSASRLIDPGAHVRRRAARELLTFVMVLLAYGMQAAVAQTTQPPLLLGTAWYPEQWPESAWDTDLTWMEKANIHVVRVGEFAWSTMEPSEGHFEFGWLDRAIDLAARHHIWVVLGTPTAAPPAWLTSKYPETLRVEEDGQRAEHGGRAQFSFANSRYRSFCAEIARQMAARYGHNPQVIGWQIDNEIGAPTFDPSAIEQWHAWLKKKYVTIGDLNRRWTTAYWSQTYDTFDQVPFHSRNENPALLLDYKRFVTDVWTSYIDTQVDAIRPQADKRQFITTNTMHWYNVYDHYVLHRDLDLAAWDDYVPDGHLDPALNAIQHDLVRGYKRRNFWVMETQPAFVNWGPINAPLPPGVTREMAWQAVAHGADAVLYWQWRSALNGQEQYHGTLIGPDGLPVPIYKEVQQVGAEFLLAGDTLAGSTPRASVAILQDYPSHWAIDFQRHSQAFDYPQLLTSWYKALDPLVDGIDVVSADAPLDGYKAVFAPALNVLPKDTAQHLLDYVRHGGLLVLGPRSGMKDADDGLYPDRQPGPLKDALGAVVEQYYALDAPPDAAPKLSGAAGSGTASIWAEILHPTDANTVTLLSYDSGQRGENGWLAGKAAAVSHKVDNGTLAYIGAVLDPALLHATLSQMLTGTGVRPLMAGLPESVELRQRSAPGKPTVWIMINHSATQQHVDLPSAMTDLLHPGGNNVHDIDLGAHGVAVLTSRGAQ